MKRTYSISTLTILQIIGVVGLVLAVFILQRIIFMILAAFILAAAVNVGANWLENYQVPRLVAVLFWFVMFLGLLAFALAAFVPVLLTQLSELVEALPQTISSLSSALPDPASQWVENIREQVNIQSVISQVSQSFFSTTISILGGVISVVLTLILAFYIAMEPYAFDTILVRFAPREKQSWIRMYVVQARERIGQWLVGHIAMALILGLLVFMILVLLNVKYALALAFLAGILQLIPFLGPVLAAVPAFLFAWLESPYLAILVLVGYTIVYQIETLFLTPMLLRRSIGLNPVIIILALFVGARLAGFVGFLLAVPVVGALFVVWSEVNGADRITHTESEYN